MLALYTEAVHVGTLLAPLKFHPAICAAFAIKGTAKRNAVKTGKKNFQGLEVLPRTSSKGWKKRFAR